ncbi:MAG: hypothetical protein IJW49_09075 [Clostridia bacterium]|nr:hypothetical protein [Clostridia bacterium]
MKLSLIHLTVLKKNLKKLALILLGIGAFYAVVCTPLYHVTNSDILFRDGVASLVVDYVMDITNFLFYWISFAFLLYVGITLGKTTLFRPFLIVIGGAVIFRYFASLIAGYLINGIPTKWSVWREDLLYLAIDVLLDAAQITVAFLLIYRRSQQMSGSSKYFPVTKPEDRQNPVVMTAALLAAIPSVIHLITRVIYDIWEGYIPQDGGDLLWMILGYASELLGFVAGFFVIILVINHLYMKAKAMQIAYDEAKNSILNPNTEKKSEQE